MSCILRYSGEHLDVDVLLAAVGLQPDRIWRKGEARLARRPEGKTNRNSGVTFLVSNADFGEFDTQVEDATQFLEKHREDVRLMSDFDAVEHAVLDFGIKWRDVAVHSDQLSPGFLLAAAAVGVWVKLSHYPCSEDEDKSEQVEAPDAE